MGLSAKVISGFAWGTVNAASQACGPNPLGPNVVVAAVSQAYEVGLEPTR